MLRQLTDLRTVSEKTGIPYSTLRQYVSQGRLRAYRVAGTPRLRVAEQDVEELFVPVLHDYKSDRQPNQPRETRSGNTE